MGSTNRNSFLRPLKNKGFQEEIVTKIGLYALVKSTPLESKKSLSMTLVTGLRRVVSRRERYADVSLGQPSLPRGLRPLESLHNAWMPRSLRSSAEILPSTANCSLPQATPPPAAWARNSSSPSSALRASSLRPLSRFHVPPRPS